MFTPRWCHKRFRTLTAAALLAAALAPAGAALAATAPIGSARPAHAVPPDHAATTVASGAARETGRRPKLTWKPCGIVHPGYDCAVFKVPLDYDRRGAGSTWLALNRLPATHPEARVGTLFVNPGGPGGSGVDLVFSRFGHYLSEQLDGRFDIVGFDPRGVAASDPLHCFASKQALFAFLFSQPVFPYSKRQYRDYFDAFASLGQKCREDGPLVEHMNTADVARDLDRLRRAVGDPGLTYLGFSYGSYLGNTYANLFPDKVRALAIDGVLNPQMWSSGKQVESDRVATQAEFDEFLRLCDEAGPECAFWTGTGSAQRWADLARAVRRDPLAVPGGFVYTYDFLINDALGAMYAPEVWDGPNGAAALFDFLADAVLAGQPGAAAEAGRVRAALAQQLRPPRDREATYSNWLDSYYGNQCADTQYPHAFSDWRAIDRYARSGSRFGPIWWWENTGCAHWPVNKDRYTGPWTAQTSAPVLVVGNYFDGVTDHAGAVATAGLLPNSRLLSYAGWGHTAYKRNPCVTEHINAYLLAGVLPPEGTVCPANPNPFQPEGGRANLRARVLVGLPPAWLLR